MEMPMKLYFHPVSTVSRPVMLFAADEGIALEMQMVDLFKGEHKQPAYLAVNPSGQVPTLEDGDFRLTESSAILKYLADKKGSAAYPADLKQRARINEMMDWFNTGFYRELGYGMVYGQTLPDYIYDEAAVQSAVLARAQKKANHWLGILDQSLLGSSKKFICGNDITLADYLGVCFLTLGEVAHLKFNAYPNVTRWIDTMKARPTWAKVNEGFYQYFVGGYKDGKFLGL
jgi:glutathione S-transferase